MNKFSKGTRVGIPDDEWNPDEDTSLRGVVLEVNEKYNKILVQWDSKWMKPNPQEIHENELMLESDLNKELSKLEKEYNAYAEPIAKKIAQAAKLLTEAADLASDNDKELQYMYDVLDPLMKAALYSSLMCVIILTYLAQDSLPK